ncbi:MAG: hypothetical protein RDU14_10225 [Melioribacteraceae bacterium]|nr:hypothetical protein [Melioribacteraceae bacterium]
MKNLTHHIAGILLLLLFVSSVILSQEKILERKPLTFDFGSNNSSKYLNSVIVDENTKYDLIYGYGWVIPPNYSFERIGFRGTTLRNDLTKDGVTGKEIEFKVNIPSGKWWFTFWMEAGNDYTNSAILKINGEAKKIDWFRIKAGEEGESQQMKLYRVYHSLSEIGEGGFTLNLNGGKDSIRIHGVTLIPFEEPVSELHLKYDRIVKEAGKYKSKISLFDLAKYLMEQAVINPNDSYTYYLFQQTSLFAEADRLLSMMGWEWASQITGFGIFDRLHQVICLLDAQLEHNYNHLNPFRERALWMRGKLGYDLNLQRGGEHEKEIAEKDLAELYKIYDDDENLAMFNGAVIDQPDYCDCLMVNEEAPEWSILQRELICRLSSEIKWWVTERQAPNGEFGGKIGDDVELLRWWTPFLLTGNKNAVKGWKKLADEVWKSPKVYMGYSRFPIDVEHAAEFISDSTPELLFVDEDSTYFKRLLYTANYFENLWSVKNKFGRRFFKSAWFGSTDVDERPPRNRDVDYNTRALKPLRYIAWSSRNPHFINLLNEWSEAWLYVAFKTDKGKPRGIIPSSVRGYDEAINGDGESWYRSDMLWDYFDWAHSVGSMILDQLFFTYSLNGNIKLLEPITLSLELINKNYEKVAQINNFSEGSEEWTVNKLISKSNFWDVIGKWRLNTNNRKYDSLLMQFGNEYTKYRLSKNGNYLIDGLNKALEEVRYNTPLRTTLVLHTDRVRTKGADLLKAMLTGDGTPEGSSPYYAVTWENTNNNFTALVTDSDKNKLFLDLFSFDKKEQNIIARVWQLGNGEYSLTYKNKDGKEVSKELLTINKVGQRINLLIPSNQLVTVEIKKTTTDKK